MSRDQQSDTDRIVDVLGVIAGALKRLVDEVKTLRREARALERLKVKTLRREAPIDSSQPEINDLLVRR